MSYIKKKIIKICKWCKKEYGVSHCRHEISNFCSQKCKGEWQSMNCCGEDNPNWQGGKVILICDWCGKEYTDFKAREEISHFCSIECQSKWQSKIRVGENSSNWKGGRIILVCEWCNEEFEVDLYQKDVARFCSQKCKGEWQSMNCCGEKSTNWQGGISFDPYCEKFNKVKKKEVRDKYNNCDYLTGIHRDICNKDKNGKIRELAVHHFDYNKMQGCDDIKWKLVPVSHRHNTMFNTNRPFWKRLIEYSLEYDKDYYNEEFNMFKNIKELIYGSKN